MVFVIKYDFGIEMYIYCIINFFYKKIIFVSDYCKILSVIGIEVVNLYVGFVVFVIM